MKALITTAILLTLVLAMSCGKETQGSKQTSHAPKLDPSPVITIEMEYRKAGGGSCIATVTVLHEDVLAATSGHLCDRGGSFSYGTGDKLTLYCRDIFGENFCEHGTNTDGTAWTSCSLPKDATNDCQWNTPYAIKEGGQ